MQYCILKLTSLYFRFDIDVYNMDAFVICLLPFHESKIFVRAVQLLKLKSKTATKWDWLLPIQVNQEVKVVCHTQYLYY